MSNIQMKLLTVGDRTYEVVDETARNTVARLQGFMPLEIEWEGTTSFAGVDSETNRIFIREQGSGYDYAIIPVFPGEVYHIRGAHHWESVCYAVADQEQVVLLEDGVADDGITHIEAEFTIPDGAKYLYVNKAEFISLARKAIISSCDQRIQILADRMSAIEGNTETVFLPMEIEWSYPDRYIWYNSDSNSLETVESAGWNYTVLEVKEDEVYYIDGAHTWNAFAYCVTDAENQILLQDGASNGELTYIITSFTIPSGAKYLYLNSVDFKQLSKQAVITGYVKDPLTNKKIVYDGDSICYGAGYSGGYGAIIADETYGVSANQAHGGGILCSAGALGENSHSVTDNLPNLPADGDLYCFQGGINDFWGNHTLGTYSKSDYTGEPDPTTVCGALETIFRYALNNFVGKPICFVITHKIQNTAYQANSMGDTFEDYRNAMVGICNKYSIPFYDAFYESGLNGWNEVQSSTYLTGNAENVPDGCHPNEEGYKRYYVPQLLDLFRRILPAG